MTSNVGLKTTLLAATSHGLYSFNTASSSHWTALLQPEAGIVRADLAQRAFLDSALGEGARLVTTGRAWRAGHGASLDGHSAGS